MIEPVIFTVNDARWLNLIEQDPAATIFHHPAWMEVLSTCYHYRTFIFAISDRNGQVCAGLPVAEVNDHLTPRRWVTLPFSDYCRPLYQDEQSLRQLANALVEQQQARRCPRLEIRATFPAQPHIQAQTPFVLHTIGLEADSTLVAKRAHRQQMQNVRTAEKNNIRIVRGVGLKEMRAFYQLHSLNRRKHGVPVQPWNFFKLLTRLLLEQGLGYVLLAYKENTCISAGLFLHWQKTLTYKYSATDEAYQNLRPNHLATWTAIEWGCKNGFTTFDFGRADLADEGLRTFKRRWGAAEEPLSYSYIPFMPRVPTRGNGIFASVFKEIIRRSPLWVCHAFGEILYRYVG